MAHVIQFEKSLNKLFRDRTYRLRKSLGLKMRGAKPLITRKRINRTIVDLQDLASSILAGGLAKKEFLQNAGPKKGKKIKGHGWRKQKINFDSWLKTQFPRSNNLVYVFWRGKKCLYVGRTGVGGSRPSSHFNKKGFLPTRIDIYPSKSKSQTPKLECLAVHRFEPSINRYKAAKKKWTKKCPLCTVHKHIEADLRKIFRIR
jgi:hypothetical protein